jgi:hypothetical protein
VAALVLADTLTTPAFLIVAAVVVGAALVLADACTVAELLVVPADRRDDGPRIAAPGYTASGVATATAPTAGAVGADLPSLAVGVGAALALADARTIGGADLASATIGVGAALVVLDARLVALIEALRAGLSLDALARLTGCPIRSTGGAIRL